MDHQERARAITRSQAGNAALRIVAEYGPELAADLITEAIDVLVRSLGAVTSPQEARDRLSDAVGALPPRRTNEPLRLVVSN